MNTLEQELHLIKGKKDKLLPEDVVNWAERHPKSLCYQEFEWDDSKAAHAHRLLQARNLIKIHVIPDSTLPVFVSLSIDRVEGGYRELSDVLKAPKLREVLVQDALAEFARLRERHADLVELRPIFEAIDAFASVAV